MANGIPLSTIRHTQECQEIKIVSNAGAPLRVRCDVGEVAISAANITVDGVKVTATIEDGIATIPCKINQVVKVRFTNEPEVVDVTAISLDKSEVTLVEGEEVTLEATVTPANATNSTVTWTTSKEAVATVDNGLVKAVAAGEAVITAEAGGKTATCVVTVEAEEPEEPETVTEVKIMMNEYGSATYCSAYSLDFTNVAGLKAYAATGYNKATGVVTMTRVQTTQSGIGLFLKGTQSVEYAVPVIEDSEDYSLNMLCGVLEPTVVNSTSSDGVYANYKYTIKDGNTAPGFYRFADNVNFSAGKAYLQIPIGWLSQEASKSVAIEFDDETTTVITEVKGEGVQKSVFDLAGRKVNGVVAPGVYIVNGVKQVVK